MSVQQSRARVNKLLSSRCGPFIDIRGMITIVEIAETGVRTVLFLITLYCVVFVPYL